MDGVCGPASPMGHWSASGIAAAASRAVRRIGNHTDQKFSADLTLLLLLLLLLLALHYYDW
jgi:hypothetical protein